MRWRVAVFLVAIVGGLIVVTAVRADGDMPPGDYVQGYWPGDNPALCIVDHAEGFPVAEAVAEYDQVDGITVHLDPNCPSHAAPLPVAAIGELPCDGPNGCFVRGEGSFQDHNGLWVHAPQAIIWLNVERDNTDDLWRKIIVHELGHAVGLAHTDADSVMRRDNDGVIDNGVYGLTDLDVATINALYSG